MNEIIVFSMNGCGHCVKLKQKLNKEQVPFTELEINSNRTIWDQVVTQTSQNVLPTVFVKIEDSEDGPVFVPGRDFNTSDELYEKIKIFI